MTAPMTDQLQRLRRGDSVALAQRPIRMALALLGALAFTALGVFLLVIGVRESVAGRFHVGVVLVWLLGMALIGFFGVACLGALIGSTVRPRRLVLTREEFREEVRRDDHWHTLATVSWHEVTGFEIDHIRPPKSLFWKGIPVLTYQLTDDGIDRLHRDRQQSRRTRPPPPRRVVLRTAFAPAQRLHPLFEAAHREFGGMSP